MIYLNDSSACVMYIKSKKTAYIAVEGFVTSETIRNCVNALTVLCVNHDVKNILFDSSYLDVIKKDDIMWITQKIYPNYKSFNLEKVTYIKPLNIFGKYL